MTKVYHPDKLFFSADLHFFHGKLVEKGYRPFSSLDEMHEVIIANWNAKVPKDGIVFFLGDLAFAGYTKVLDIVLQLNGSIIWVPGNHDKKLMNQMVARLAPKFQKVDSIYEIDVEDSSFPRGKQRITLAHYPMLTWNRAGYGAWHLHGHSHGSAQYPWSGPWMDVGVDPNGFAPVSYAEVKDRLGGVRYTVMDHHREIGEWKDADA